MLLTRVLVSLLTAQEPAPADVAVRWTAPAGCPDREALLAALARRLGRPLAPGEATIEARIGGAAGRYTLDLRLAVGAAREARRLQDPSCVALTDAAALRVVVMLESRPVVPPPVGARSVELSPGTGDGAGGGASRGTAPGGGGAIPRERAPGAGPVEAAVRPEDGPRDMSPGTGSVDAAVKREDGPRDMSRRTGSEDESVSQADSKDMSRGPGAVIRVHGGAELGAVPGPTGAVGLAVGLLWPRLRVELQAEVLAPRTASRPPGEVRAGLFAGAAHGCGRLGRGALEFPLCVGLELGALRGSVTGLPGGRTAAGVWVAAVLGPGLVWHAGRRVGLWAGLQMVVAPVRPVFQQGGGAAAVAIFTPSVVSGRLLVGVELRLRDRW